MKPTEAKIHIKTFEDLIVFLEANFEFIDDKEIETYANTVIAPIAVMKPLINAESYSLIAIKRG